MFLVFHINVNTTSCGIESVDFVDFFDDSKWLKISLNP